MNWKGRYIKSEWGREEAGPGSRWRTVRASFSHPTLSSRSRCNSTSTRAWPGGAQRLHVTDTSETYPCGKPGDWSHPDRGRAWHTLPSSTHTLTERRTDGQMFRQMLRQMLSVFWRLVSSLSKTKSTTEVKIALLSPVWSNCNKYNVPLTRKCA